MDDPALGRRRGDTRDALEVEGVVGDDELRAPGDGLIGNGPDRIDRQKDPRDLGIWITDDGADRIPVIGPAGVVQRIELGDHIAQGQSHGMNLKAV